MKEQIIHAGPRNGCILGRTVIDAEERIATHGVRALTYRCKG